MRISFPHPLLVRSGHVESTGDFFVSPMGIEQPSSPPPTPPSLSLCPTSGVMIYYPVFGAFLSFFEGSMYDYLRDTVSVRKDVEGVCHTYRRSLYHNIKCGSSMVCS